MNGAKAVRSAAMRAEFTGIVLAGGRSSRMGRDKAALPWAGGTLLDHMIDTLRQAGAARVLVSGERPSHEGIGDAWPGRGPVGGFASVLPHCRDGIAVVVPVDLPMLDARRIDALAAAVVSHRAASCAGHPLPFALQVDATTRRTVDELIATSPDGPSVRHLLQTFGAVEVPALDATDLRPCNTPADWAAIAG